MTLDDNCQKGNCRSGVLQHTSNSIARRITIILPSLLPLVVGWLALTLLCHTGYVRGVWWSLFSLPTRDDAATAWCWYNPPPPKTTPNDHAFLGPHSVDACVCVTVWLSVCVCIYDVPTLGFSSGFWVCGFLLDLLPVVSVDGFLLVLFSPPSPPPPLFVVFLTTTTRAIDKS